ncbi:MAG: hypothetical protein WAM73_15225 [Desulfobacterales bacterium]
MATMQTKMQMKKVSPEMLEAEELLFPKPGSREVHVKLRATEVGANDITMRRRNAFLISLLVFFLFPITAFCDGNLHQAAPVENIEMDGAGPEIKAVTKNRQKIVSNMDSEKSSRKSYDHDAKTLYSENDVKAFVYQRFAGFDHQVDIAFFKKHLNPGKIDMRFPDFPIQNLSDFERWYNNVIATIKWNAHKILKLNVAGDEISGFSVSLVVNWKAKTYDGKNYDMNVHQGWQVTTDKNRNFIIEKLRAEVIDNN